MARTVSCRDMWSAACKRVRHRNVVSRIIPTPENHTGSVDAICDEGNGVFEFRGDCWSSPGLSLAVDTGEHRKGRGAVALVASTSHVGRVVVQAPGDNGRWAKRGTCAV